MKNKYIRIIADYQRMKAKGYSNTDALKRTGAKYFIGPRRVRQIIEKYADSVGSC
jgi:hypothetical protein